MDPAVLAWALARLAGSRVSALAAGFAAGGLPVGLQLMAKPFDETALLRIGHAVERATAWHRWVPPAAALFE